MKPRSTRSLRAKSEVLQGLKSPRSWTAIAAAAFAGLSIVPAVQADIAAPGFNNGEGAGANQWTLNRAAANPAGVPSIAANVLTLTTNANNEGSSAWYNTAQGINNFTAQFTYTFVNGSSPPADGFAFVLQNDTLSALGGGGGGLGYVGGNLGNSTGDRSVALAFDMWNGGNTASPRVTRTGFSGTGYGGIVYQATDPLFTAPGNPVTVILSDPTPITIKIDYDNGVFTRTLTQGTNVVTKTQNLNIVDRGLGASAFVGFTGGTGGANATTTFSNFSYTTGTAPAAPAAATIRTNVPQGGVGTWGIREFLSPTALGNLTDAENAIASGSTTNDYTAPVVNLYDSGGRGRFRSDTLYKSDLDQTAGANNTAGNDTVNNIAVIATATMRIPTSGVYSFGVNSDDGFRMTIDGKRFEAFGGQFNAALNATDRTVINPNGALEFAVGRGVNDSIGTIYLPAGDHKIQVLNWEGGGGAAVEVYAAAGGRQGFDYTQFSLLGSAGVPARSGFNRVGTTSDWTYTPYTNAANVTEVLTAGRGGGGPPVAGTTVMVPTVHFSDPQGANNGSHGTDGSPIAFPGDTAADDNNFGGYATMQLTITEPNVYTFMMYTDDDSRFRIANAATPTQFLPLVGNVTGDAFDSNGDGIDDQFGTGGCCFDQFGHYNLAAGTYNIEAAFHEGGGGSGFFIFATQGERDNFNAADFQLLGADTVGGAWNIAAVAGIQLVPEPGSISMLGLAAVGLMARRRRQ